MQPYHFRIEPAHSFATQMNDDLARRAQLLFDEQEKAKAAFDSVAAFEAHREQVRANFLEAIGGLPAEKCPLNAQTTGVIEEENFTIEKVLFESLPGYLVSGSCYVPRGVKSDLPAVLFVCGHSGIGKAHDTYQKVCRDLASNGFVVLAIDPFGQGNRLQYLKDGVDTQQSCTVEHTHAGFQFLLQGASVARHFVWDGIRAVDYLSERPEVDSTRIGITGNSGGGTQTSYLMMCEPRLAAAVPGTFVSSLEAIMESGAPQDMEQIVARAMLHGPDHDDFFTAIAPRPALLGVVNYDFFPIEGSLQTFERAQHVYELYGKSENVDMTDVPSLHGYSDGLREAAVNWFKRHLKGEEGDFVTGDPGILPAEKLDVTPSGNVLLDYPQSRSIFDLNLELLEKITTPQGADAAQLRENLSEVLGVDKAGRRDAAILPRISQGEHEGYKVERIWFFSAPKIITAGALFFPRETAKAQATTLLVLENGTADLPAQMELLEKLLQEGKAVFVVDPRGIGSLESFPASNYGNRHPVFNSEYKMACDAMMMGMSTMGLRVFDLLRAYDYLQSRDELGAIEIYGVGHGANWAYFAAVLEEGLRAVTCEEMLGSYRQLCETKFYNHERYNLKVMAWGLLRCGDIEDFKKCIAPRPLHLLTPREDLTI